MPEPLLQLVACPTCEAWPRDREGEFCPTCHDDMHPGLVVLKHKPKLTYLTDEEYEALRLVRNDA